MDFYISIAVGITQAFMFSPIDKAIYNSIINNSKLFNRENWIKPFAGASNSIYSRIITSGLYFYLMDIYYCKITSNKCTLKKRLQSCTKKIVITY